jgi:HemX protein
VDWITDRHFFALAVSFYGISTAYAIFLWRKGFRRDNRVIYLLLLAGFAFHTTAMIKRGLTLNHCPVSNLYEATTFVTWTIALIYMVVGTFNRVRFLGAFASPFLFAIGVFALMPDLDTARTSMPTAWTSLHAAIISLAYGAFGVACVAAIMYLTQERNLKFNKLQAVFSLMPPIQRLETIVGRALLSGFVLLTAGLLVGAYGLTQLRDVPVFRADTKVIWSALVWFMYLGLIIMRWRFSQGGRRFALGAVGSFAFVLLTFWGTNVLSQLHNPQ